VAGQQEVRRDKGVAGQQKDDDYVWDHASQSGGECRGVGLKP
jgi:hypothetical protein